MSNKPIGIFDSGIGGTSIWKEIHNLLPQENTIYLADSANAPYGQKPEEKIIQLCEKNVDFLLNKNCKIIVVACNTATTNAIKHLRNKYSVPFIGIEPAIKPASLQTKTNTIGILATRGTLSSEFFEKKSSLINSNIKIIEQVGKGLVELIENGFINSNEMDVKLREYLTPMIKANIDCLVLGCTHYPYLIPQIESIIGKKIQIIDSGLAVAKQTKNILEKNNLLNEDNNLKKKHLFFINESEQILKTFIADYNNIIIERRIF